MKYTKIYKAFSSYRWLVATRLKCVGLEAWLNTEIEMEQDPFFSPVSLFCFSFGLILKDVLPPHGGKMAVTPPTYIFSGSGPISRKLFFPQQWEQKF